VLGFDEWVAEDVRVEGHCNLFVGRHGFPDLAEEETIVQADCRGCTGS